MAATPMASEVVGRTSEYSAEVPTFDFQELQRGLHEEELRQCLATIGAFQLVNNGIDEASHTPAREATVDFFLNGSAEQKESVSFSDATRRRGFTGLETESTARVTGTGKYTDYSMCFSMGKEGNLFPNKPFQEVWENYFTRLHALSKVIARMVVETATNKDGSTVKFDASHEDTLIEGDPVLRLRLFPDVPEHRVAEQEPIRMAPHYDVSLITLVHQTPCPNGFVSLQCLVDGEYRSVPPSTEGRMMVFCGAVATIVSEGKIKAAMHRVAAPPKNKQHGSKRTSSVFFLRPKDEFAFDVKKAKSHGLNISLDGDHGTFGEWMGGNYVNMRYREEKL